MYCPKCKHTSFDHLATCSKCGYDWQSIRTALNLNWLQSAGHEWLPESAPEPPEAEAEPGPSTAPEPMDFEPDVEAAERFAFDEQTLDFDLSPPEESLQNEETAHSISNRETLLAKYPSAVSEDIPTVSVAAPAQDNFEVAQPDDLSLVEVMSEDDADTAIIYQVDDPKPDFSEGAESTEEELPVWEIELPQDLLPHEYFPEPVGETSDKGEQDGVEVVGDISYDFSEVEVVPSELDAEAQPPASRDVASPSPSAADGDDAERSSAPLSSSDHKEGQ
ncbi:hypothetical protein [Desulfonatronum lacustre]|uniref:hypothetical protein n=1 Tax=Desulfonatronum lacustre TaxID=66849 RepID=UPI00048F453A|nr:hypothetical protein [Desulfonatronum lacustre]